VILLGRCEREEIIALLLFSVSLFGFCSNSKSCTNFLRTSLIVKSFGLFLHGCEQSCGAETVSVIRGRRGRRFLGCRCGMLVIKDLQAVGHGQEVGLHLVLVQVVVVEVVVLLLLGVVVEVFVTSKDAPGSPGLGPGGCRVSYVL